MARYAKKGSTKIEILEQMFKEIQNHPDAEWEDLGNKTLADYQQFSQISPSNYNELIEAYINIRVAYDDSAPANKDVKKINFDFENYEIDEEDPDFTLHNSLPDGTSIIWAWAGGDWESSISFILYLDPTKKIRAYIPSDGNVYCHKCKCAWGTCSCGAQEPSNFDVDYNLMYADVCNRIKTK